MIRTISLAATAVLLAGPVAAQTATATPAEAFLYAVQKVCTPNVMGALSLHMPSPALDAAHVLLVDGASDAGTRTAFHGMPVTIDYGAVTSASGQITIGADEAGSCRVAAIDVTAAEVTAIQSALGAIDGDWNPTAHDETTGETDYSGTIDGQSVMIEAILPPSGSNWGRAGLIVTVMNPAG